MCNAFWGATSPMPTLPALSITIFEDKVPPLLVWNSNIPCVAPSLPPWIAPDTEFAPYLNSILEPYPPSSVFCSLSSSMVAPESESEICKSAPGLAVPMPTLPELSINIFTEPPVPNPNLLPEPSIETYPIPASVTNNAIPWVSSVENVSLPTTIAYGFPSSEVTFTSGPACPASSISRRAVGAVVPIPTFPPLNKAA